MKWPTIHGLASARIRRTDLIRGHGAFKRGCCNKIMRSKVYFWSQAVFQMMLSPTEVVRCWLDYLAWRTRKPLLFLLGEWRRETGSSSLEPTGQVSLVVMGNSCFGSGRSGPLFHIRLQFRPQTGRIWPDYLTLLDYQKCQFESKTSIFSSVFTFFGIFINSAHQKFFPPKILPKFRLSYYVFRKQGKVSFLENLAWSGHFFRMSIIRFWSKSSSGQIIAIWFVQVPARIPFLLAHG